MGETRFCVSVTEAGKASHESHTDYLTAAVLRFCKAMIAAQHKDAVIVLSEGEDKIIASATFAVARRNHREEHHG